MLTYIRLYPFYLFVISFIYSFFIVDNSNVLLSIDTIIYITILTLIGLSHVYYIARNNIASNNLKITYLIGLLAIHIGLLAGFSLAGHDDSLLWMTDSYSMHVPGALNVANYLHGVEELKFTMGPHGSIYLTQVWVGLFFYLFGVSTVVSSIAMIIPKVLTAYLIFILAKKLFDNEKVALVALLIYSLMPTIIFYTITFYKEAIIQLVVIFTLLNLHYMFNEGKKIYILGIIIGIIIMSNERFYLALIFLFAFFIQMIFSISNFKLYAKVLITGVGIVCAVFIINKYHLTSLDYIFTQLELTRKAYNSYSDISKAINIEIPYFVALIKILFTPYLTLNKFDIYYGYSYLLIWGSLLNQLVIMLSLIGMYIVVKSDWRRHLFILCVFTGLILLFAYLAPYSGRVRDSVYPIISIYAGYCVIYLIDKYMRVKKSHIQKTS